MIELAKYEDLKEIMNIIEETKKELRKLNNPQWGSTAEDYPNETQFKIDIQNKNLYTYKENNTIKGFITISLDNGEYNGLIENNQENSYIIKRLCVNKKYYNQNIASKLILFTEQKAAENNIQILKVDTEISNLKMQNLLKKLNYQEKGQYVFDDYPGTYVYYEKKIESD